MAEHPTKLALVDHCRRTGAPRLDWPTTPTSCTITLHFHSFRGAIIRNEYRSISLVLSISAALICIPASAPGQASEDAPPRRWKAAAELAYSDQTGNRTLRVLTGGIKASHLQKDLFRLDLVLQTRYGESEDAVVARNHFGSLAFDLRPQDSWSPFLYVDAEHDRFKRLDARISGGAGAKYTLYRSEQAETEASLSAAMLISHEEISRRPEDPSDPSRTIARWSFRARGTQELPAGARIHNTTFYQPLHDRMADYLLRSESSVRMSLTQRLALSISYQFNRTSLPPEGVGPDDRILRTGIIFDF